MKNFLFLGLLFISLNVSAQTGFSGTYIGISVSPDIGYRKLTSDEYLDWLVESRNESESPSLGFSTGFNFGHQFKNGLFIDLGVRYSSRGYRYDVPAFTLPSGEIYGAGRTVWSYNHIDLPLKWGYALAIGNVLQLKFGAGVSTNIFLKYFAKTVIKLEDGTTDVTVQSGTDDFNEVSLSAIGSVELDIKISDAFTVQIEPIFRTNFTSIIDTPILGYLYSGGINCGIQYRLGKR